MRLPKCLLRRRDVLIGTALGAAITATFNIWFNAVASRSELVGTDCLRRLAWLNEPGTRAGEWLIRSLYPITGSPWHLPLAVAGAYAALVAIWTCLTLMTIVLGRLAISLLRKRTLPRHDGT